MGITIHYAGRVASEESISALYKAAVAIAQEFKWRGSIPPSESQREMGLVFLPHNDCEPLKLCFTRTRRFSDFCKTQYAGPLVHVQVLQFFDRLSHHFSKLIVYDETEEFETNRDIGLLQEVFSRELEYIKQGLVEHPGTQMQVRLPNGRIADLVG